MNRTLRPGRPERTRRAVLARAGGVLCLALVRGVHAARADMERAITEFAGGAPIAAGRVRLDVPELVENGNSVPVVVSVDGPVTPDRFVRRIAVFNEKNPQTHVAVFELGPRAGRVHVSTRMRMADSQAIVAVAELSDGTFWSDRVEVVVTLAACLE